MHDILPHTTTAHLHQVIPILRAGLVLLEQAQTVLPASETYHVGYVRSEDTLEASCYLNKLPKQFSPDDLILITDPMLATGGTIVKVGSSRPAWRAPRLHLWCTCWQVACCCSRCHGTTLPPAGFP